jgi:hypothetical protein
MGESVKTINICQLTRERHGEGHCGVRRCANLCSEALKISKEREQERKGNLNE